jgi:1,2-diacylglycerol 3-alpha-glucosyltransferase
MFGKLMAAALNRPTVHTYHTLYEDYVHYITKGMFPHFSAEMARLFSRKFCNSCDAVVAPTGKIRDLLLEYSVHKPISVIPTGIDTEQFSGAPEGAESAAEIAALKNDLGIAAGDKVILYVGRLAKEKNIDGIVANLPHYIKSNPNTKFLLVGNGPWKKEIESLAREGGIGGSLVFAGEQPWRGIAKFYRLGDVFISASLSETQGLTFIEAMAAGLPVLARNDRSVEKLIFDNETGCLFNDEAEIPGKLQKMLSDGAFRERLVANALKIAAQNSAAQFAKGIEAVYEDTIRNWRPPAGKKNMFAKKMLRKIIL